MPSASRTHRRSVAQRALDPLELIAIANDNTVEGAWRAFDRRLKKAGFSSCGFLVSERTAAAPLSCPTSIILGEVVSSEYLAAARADRSLQENARPYRMIRRTPKPVTYLSDADLAGASPSERALASQVNNAFGLKAWALAPVHDNDSGRMFTLGWWNLESQKEAQALWRAERGAFALAANYFSETMRALIERDGEEARPALSPRETECLLWAGAGKTTMEIADILGVADGTIEEYFNRAAKKLGAATRAQACVKAILRGVIRP